VLRFVVVPGSIPGTNEVTNEELISLIMGKYRRLLLPVLLFLVLTLFIQLVVLTHALGGKLRISIALVSIAALLETYVRFALFPRLQKLAATEHRRPKDEKNVHRLRGISRRILGVNFFLGIAVVISLISSSI